MPKKIALKISITNMRPKIENTIKEEEFLKAGTIIKQKPANKSVGSKTIKFSSLACIF